jgi:hypothetical protein
VQIDEIILTQEEPVLPYPDGQVQVAGALEVMLHVLSRSKYPDGQVQS